MAKRRASERRNGARGDGGGGQPRRRSAAASSDDARKTRRTERVPRLATPSPPLIRQRRVAQRTNVLEEYVGYVPTSFSTPNRERIDDVDAEMLWQKYISTRCPVLIDGLVKDGGFEGERWRDVEYLRSIAGSAMVKIEPIDPKVDHFGTGAQRKEVSLSTFLDMMGDANQAGKWYMTTQYGEEDDGEEEDEDDDESEQSNRSSSSNASQSSSPSSSSATSPPSTSGSHRREKAIPSEEEEEGENEVEKDDLPDIDLDLSLPPPTDALAHLFPLPAPSIMGGLVLQQCNLWMGNGTSGKSSGLHHDFHDNLYMLLSGRKRFLIWPPMAHRWLEPVGSVYRVHANGLMEYDLAEQPPLRPDGLTQLEASAWLVRARKRAVLEADERAAQGTGEAKLRRGQRKGKAKQTAEQEVASERLRQAELQKLLLELQERGDEDGFEDDEADLSAEHDLFEGDSSIDSSEGGEAEEDNDSNIDSEDDDDDSDNDADLRALLAARLMDEVDSEEYEEEESEDEEVDRRRKRQRREGSILRIPRRGLPGGLRGSLNDLDGYHDSGEDDEFSEDAEYIIDPAAEGPEITAALVQELMAARSTDEGTEDELRRLLLHHAQDDDDDDDDDDSAEEDDVSHDHDESDDDGAGDAIDRHLERMLQQVRESTSSSGEDDSEDDEDEESEEEEGSDDESWLQAEDGEALLDRLEALDQSSDQPTLRNGQADDEEDPPSFSKITPQAMHWFFDKPDDPADGEEAEVALHPPSMSTGGPTLIPRHGCPPPLEIHLKPGQMLYLPASWYHEVTSYCDPHEGDDGEPSSNVHMALNYWFHPPTAIKPRESLRKRLGSVQKRKVKGRSEANGAGTASSKRQAAGEDEEGFPNCTKPYLDDEVWDEIRREVEKRVKAVKRRALAAHMASQKTTRNAERNTNGEKEKRS